MLFNSKNADLKAQNRILTDAARRRAERVAELERLVDQLQLQVSELQNRQASDQPGKIEELARMVNERDQRLVELGDAATRYSLWGQKLESLLTETARIVNERDQRLVELGDAATRYSLWGQKLESLLTEAGYEAPELKAVRSSILGKFAY